jgi:hypothetical protein
MPANRHTLNLPDAAALASLLKQTETAILLDAYEYYSGRLNLSQMLDTAFFGAWDHEVRQAILAGETFS